jgi:predicted CopG family antitoxin
MAAEKNIGVRSSIYDRLTEIKFQRGASEKKTISYSDVIEGLLDHKDSENPHQQNDQSVSSKTQGVKA